MKGDAGRHIRPLNLGMREAEPAAARVAVFQFAFIRAIPDERNRPPVETHRPTPLLDKLLDTSLLFAKLFVVQSVSDRAGLLLEELTTVPGIVHDELIVRSFDPYLRIARAEGSGLDMRLQIV